MCILYSVSVSDMHRGSSYDDIWMLSVVFVALLIDGSLLDKYLFTCRNMFVLDFVC